MTHRDPPKKRSRSGCLYVLWIGLICILLLTVNGILVRSFLAANGNLITELRVEQAIQYIVPVVMIFFEFWMFDLFLDRS